MMSVASSTTPGMKKIVQHAFDLHGG